MLPENHHFRLIQNITEETVEDQNLSQYNLFLSMGRQNIRFGVVDISRHKFIALEDYEVSNIFTPQQAAQLFKEYFVHHPYVFRAGWHQIRIGIKNQHFTFLPESLYDADAIADYLRLNCDFDPDHEEIFTFKHNSIAAVSVFGVDKYLLQVWQELQPESPVQYLHLTSSLIASLLHHTERSEQKKLFAYIELKSLCILVIREGNLEFCNLFQVNTPEDVLYYLVFVMQELKLNPDADRITIWGDLTHDSPLFYLLRKYIRHVQFGSRPSGVGYSYKLEDMFEHRYLDVYSLPFGE